MLREKFKQPKLQGESTEAGHWGGPTRMSDEGPVMGLEQRGWVRWSHLAKQLENRMNSMHATNKPFHIDKRLVYEAYKAVKSNRGAAGVDEQTIEQFEADLSGNLYKIWNRMSSGTYFPPPVRAVAIPKKSGGERILGVPQLSLQNIAQKLNPLLRGWIAYYGRYAPSAL